MLELGLAENHWLKNERGSLSGIDKQTADTTSSRYIFMVLSLSNS